MSILRRVARFVAEYEFWLLWVYGVPLLISSSLPLWIFAATLATVPLFWVARRIARGAFTIPTTLDLPIVILGCLGIVGVVVSIEPMTSLRMYLEFVGVTALYFGIVNGRASRGIEPGIWILLGLGTLMGIVGLLGLRYSEKFLPTSVLTHFPKFDLSVFNPRGFTPNIVAGAIAPVVPVAVAWAFTQTRIRRAFLLGLAIFLLGIVALTQSRGALMGIMVALGVLLVWRLPRLVWLVPVAVGVGIGALVLLRPANLADALLAIDSTGSTAGRLELWDRALLILSDFPFTGIGLGTFDKVVPVLYPLFINDPGAPLPHAHNLYLQMGVDYGFGGLVAFIGLIVAVFSMGLWNVKRTGKTREGWVAIGLFVGYLVYLTHGLLDAVTISTKVSVIVWLIIGLTTVLSRQAHRTRI